MVHAILASLIIVTYLVAINSWCQFKPCLWCIHLGLAHYYSIAVGYSYNWGERERAPPVVLYVAPFYIILYIYIYIYPYVQGPPCIKPVLLTRRAPAKYTTSTFHNPTKWPKKKAPIYKACTSYATCSGQVYDVRIP